MCTCTRNLFTSTYISNNLFDKQNWKVRTERVINTKIKWDCSIFYSLLYLSILNQALANQVSETLVLPKRMRVFALISIWSRVYMHYYCWRRNCGRYPFVLLLFLAECSGARSGIWNFDFLIPQERPPANGWVRTHMMFLNSSCFVDYILYSNICFIITVKTLEVLPLWCVSEPLATTVSYFGKIQWAPLTSQKVETNK